MGRCTGASAVLVAARIGTTSALRFSSGATRSPGVLGRLLRSLAFTHCSLAGHRQCKAQQTFADQNVTVGDYLLYYKQGAA